MKTTMRYVKPTDDDVRGAMEKIRNDDYCDVIFESFIVHFAIIKKLIL